MKISENQNSNQNLSTKIQLTIFSAALITRIVSLLTLIPGKRYLGSDSKLYLEIASNILNGNGFAANQTATAFVSPGYPIFLAICQTVFGENFLWASIIQCLFSSTTCVIIGKIAARMFGKTVGLTAGLIAAFYYELIIFAAPQLLTEPLYIFFLAAAIYYLVSALTVAENKSRLFILSGICFGFAGLFRPLAVPIVFSVCLFLSVIYFWHKNYKIFQPFLLLAACLLVMLPWGIRNYLTLDHFTILSLEGGHVFWLGNNPGYDKFDHPDMSKFGGYTTMFQPFPEEVTQAKNEVESNAAFYRIAWQHIFQHPLNFIIRGFHKTWNMWRPTFSGSSTKNLLISLTIYPFVLFSALGAMFFTLKSQKFYLSKVTLMVLIWIFLTHLAIHFLVTGEIRFRLPLWTILIPFSAYFLTNLFNRLLDKHFRIKPEFS